MNGSDLASGVAAMMFPYIVGFALVCAIIGAGIAALVMWLF